MIHRLQQGEVPNKPHTTFYQGDQLAFEHCFTRQGFDGAYAILYHPHPPHYIDEQEEMGWHPGYSETEAVGRPLRRHFQTQKLSASKGAILGRERLMANADMSLWFAVTDQADDHLLINVDGDEMVYVFEGSGQVRTPFGVVPFVAEDYVYLPRGMAHRWEPDTPCRLLIMEGHSWIDVPKEFRNPMGQLKMDAPYCHRDFKTPQWSADQHVGQPLDVLVKKDHHLTRQRYRHSPLEVLGWDGQLWPYAFPIRAFEPKTGLTHLPPTIHTTFVGGGFVICSFVPRLVDFHPQAIPCPYPHSSVDCDEFIFYIEGNFTSRKGIGPGSVTLHPTGLPHGPHPGTYEASIGSKETNEMALMVDTFKPLLPTLRATNLEENDYQMSWIKA